MYLITVIFIIIDSIILYWKWSGLTVNGCEGKMSIWTSGCSRKIVSRVCLFPFAISCVLSTGRTTSCWTRDYSRISTHKTLFNLHTLLAKWLFLILNVLRKKLRLRKVQQLVQDATATQWLSWDLGPRACALNCHSPVVKSGSQGPPGGSQKDSSAAWGACGVEGGACLGGGGYGWWLSLCIICGRSSFFSPRRLPLSLAAPWVTSQLSIRSQHSLLSWGPGEIAGFIISRDSSLHTLPSWVGSVP